MNKPYSESCDQNKAAILSVISSIYSNNSNVLEIGSGTGQHALFFAEKMPGLTWHTSDCKPYLSGISMWLGGAELSNVIAPLELDVTTSTWPEIDVDAVFTANSLHIMNDREVEAFMKGVGDLLSPKSNLVIYGPFNYAGSYTSASNESFDQWLKGRDDKSGIKNFEDITKMAADNGFQLVCDYEMPANNRILHFVKD
jgi:cyclopropane fatty-acyl-phospholipid synthase-like methyltransferase